MRRRAPLRGCRARGPGHLPHLRVRARGTAAEPDPPGATARGTLWRGNPALPGRQVRPERALLHRSDPAAGRRVAKRGPHHAVWPAGNRQQRRAGADLRPGCGCGPGPRVRGRRVRGHRRRKLPVRGAVRRAAPVGDHQPRQPGQALRGSHPVGRGAGQIPRRCVHSGRAGLPGQRGGAVPDRAAPLLDLANRRRMGRWLAQRQLRVDVLAPGGPVCQPHRVCDAGPRAFAYRRRPATRTPRTPPVAL